MTLFALDGQAPVVPASAYVSPMASLIGQVFLGEHTSVWDFAAIRGDNEPIHIGEGSNIQENSVLHTDIDYPLVIEAMVTIGHNVVLHGCTVKRGSLIGIGAIILNGAVIGEESLIGANCLVTEGKIIPPRSLVLGSPGKVVRSLTPEEIASIRKNTQHYIDKIPLYQSNCIPITPLPR